MINRVIILVALFAFTFAQAATTGSIILSGISAKKVSIVVAPQTGYDNLDLYSSQSDLLVAAITEKSNVKNGYDVTLTSANAGLLKNGTYVQTISYTAKFNGAAVTLSATPQNITNQGSQTGVIEIAKNFAISYTGVIQDDLLEGTYSDTLTFTIAAK